MQLATRLPFAANLKRSGRSLLLVFVVFYLGFHAISGERGLVAWFKESRKLEALHTELASIKSQREALDKKVKLMSASSIDPDMLDEEARKTLGLAKADEVIILQPSK